MWELECSSKFDHLIKIKEDMDIGISQKSNFRQELQLYRSSRSLMFFEIGVFKNFAVFAGKHLCWSLFLIKLQAWSPFVKLQSFKNSFFKRTSPVGYTHRSFWKRIDLTTLSPLIWHQWFLNPTSNGLFARQYGWKELYHPPHILELFCFRLGRIVIWLLLYKIVLWKQWDDAGWLVWGVVNFSTFALRYHKCKKVKRILYQRNYSLTKEGMGVTLCDLWLKLYRLQLLSWKARAKKILRKVKEFQSHWINEYMINVNDHFPIALNIRVSWATLDLF